MKLHSEYFRGFPGTVSLSADAFMSFVYDESVSLLEHGFKRILYINGYAGNSPLIDVTVRKPMRGWDASFAKIDLWQSLSADFKHELYGEYLRASCLYCGVFFLRFIAGYDTLSQTEGKAFP